LVGRFMSADPFIQALTNLQSHNRYAYVLNNPLAYTDPNGFFFKKLFRIVATVVATIYGGPQAGAAVNAAFTYHDTGSFSAALKSAAITFATTQAFQWAGAQGGTGELGARSLERYAAHALVGCVSSAASGGSCGSGAVSALFGKFTSNQMWDMPDGVFKGVTTAIAGGVGSVIAGGKFENGAMTAAFAYLFNQMLTSKEADRLRGEKSECNPGGRTCIGVRTSIEGRMTGSSKEARTETVWNDADIPMPPNLKGALKVAETLGVGFKSGVYYVYREYEFENYEHFYREISIDGNVNPSQSQYLGYRGPSSPYWLTNPADLQKSRGYDLKLCFGDYCNR
jgi:hypothetical protein